jgi:hypothetical protein
MKATPASHSSGAICSSVRVFNADSCVGSPLTYLYVSDRLIDDAKRRWKEMKEKRTRATNQFS